MRRRIGRGPLVLGAAGTAFLVAVAYVTVRLALAAFSPDSPLPASTARCPSVTCVPVVAAPIPSFSPQSPAPSAAPAQTPTVPGPASAQASTVTIGFTERPWQGGFQGQLRIANHSGKPISRWDLTIRLPSGDWVISSGGAKTHLDRDADTLTFTPRPHDAPIPAGGTVKMFFVAVGPTPSLLSCTFDHAACA